MDALKFPSVLKEKIQNLRPVITPLPILPYMRISLRIILILQKHTEARTLALSAFKIGPRSYVASVKTTIEPMRVLNFPAVGKREEGDRRDHCLGKAETSDAPNPPSLCALTARTCALTTTGNSLRHFPHKNSTYLFQIVHSGIFSLSTFFPLSRRTVCPASDPLWPLLWHPHINYGGGMTGGRRGLQPQLDRKTTNRKYVCCGLIETEPDFIVWTSWRKKKYLKLSNKSYLNEFSDNKCN